MCKITKVFLGLIGLLGAQFAQASAGSNSINILNFSTGAILPSDVNMWVGLTDGPSLTVQSAPATPGSNSRLIVKITQNGALIFGNNATGGFPVAPFRTRSFSSTDFSLALRGGPALSPGSYTICVQFLTEDDVPISEEACRNFSVENAASPVPVFLAPRNLIPVNNKIFSQDEMRLPMSFSWSSVSPAVQGPVTYRLRIWQMLEGQSLNAVLQTDPILLRDLSDLTQVSISNFLTPPCKPPFLCKFAWNVQALNQEGVPIGAEKGTSQATIASAPAALYIIRIDSMKVACTVTAGTYAFSYYITNSNPGTAKLSNFVVTSSLPAGATISSFSPPLSTNIVSGSQLIITGLLTASPSLTSICVGAEITDLANSFNKASKDTCIKVAPCRCSACDENNLSLVTAPAILVVNTNNTLSVTQPLSVTTTPAKLIKSITAELVYFEYVPENEDCLPCNKDSKTYGNISSGILAGITGLNEGTHSMFWNFSPAISFSGGQTAFMLITLPLSVNCCSANIRWCIRYVITFNDCTVCNRLICYEKKKDGCGSTSTNPNNN